MANVDNPHGLMPLMRQLGGGASELTPYTKAAAYAYKISRWDPVTLLAGVLNGPESGITPGTTQLIGVAAAHSAVSTLADPFMVYDSPLELFDVQEDASGAANAVAAKMGYNANLALAAGGTPTRDCSACELSGTSIATTGTLDVKILKLITDPNNAYGAWARLMVKINKHLLNPGVTAT